MDSSTPLELAVTNETLSFTIILSFLIIFSTLINNNIQSKYLQYLVAIF